jgi:adenylate cyclase
MNRAIPYAYHSVLLDPGNARARCVLASALMIDGEVDAALDELDQALRLNGDSLAYREIVGWLLALCGRWERGVALMRECMDRNPYCLPHVNHGLWADALRRGDLDTAYRAALEYRDPTFFWRDLMLACSLGHLGRTIEARARTADLLQAKPEFRERGRRLIGYFIKPADLRERVIDGLAKAGLVVD